jgi:hypothetical protein
MKLTLELLKGDETRLVGELGQVTGALAYNRQLQAFLAKEDDGGGASAVAPPPDQPTATEPSPNGGIPYRELTPHG